MYYLTPNQIRAAFAGDVHLMNMLTVRHAWGVLSDTLSDVRFRAEEEEEHANMSNKAYRDYWREECATTDRGN